MRNFSKILCVVLALIVALSAASCTLSKQYSYKTDDVELPIGVYIYYLQTAYNEAQNLAQKSDKYDAEAQTYDGSKSFLKMEITDDDGVTAVAEDWIYDKTAEYMNDAVAIYHEYNELGATLDEATHDYYESYYKSYWEQGLSATYEDNGVSLDSFILAGITIPLMRSAVFEALYSDGGPKDVPDDELQKYFNDNFSSYKYFSADLFETSGDDTTQTATPLSDDEIAEYEEAFKSYAEDINTGDSFSEALEEFKLDYNSDATATEDVSHIEEDTEDEILKAILGLKEGAASAQIIGSDDASRKIYLLYKAPIADEKDYLSDDNHLLTVLSEMKTDEYDDYLKEVAKSLKTDISSACKNYKASMFEA